MRGTVFKIYFCFAVVVFSSVLHAQEYFLRSQLKTFNYSVDDFNSPSQIWAGIEGDHGTYIFGNNDKLIKYKGAKSYHGSEWSFIPSDTTGFGVSMSFLQHSKISCFFRSKNGDIYVGRDRNFGKLEYNEFGALVYKPYFVEESLGNVINISESENGELIVVSENSVLVYNESGEIIEAKVPDLLDSGEIRMAFQINEGVVLSVQKKDFQNNQIKYLFYFYHTKTKRFSRINLPVGIDLKRLSDVIKINNQRFILSENKGWFTFTISNGQLSIDSERPKQWEMFESGYNISKACLHDNRVWISSGSKGMLVTTLEGKLISSFSTNRNVNAENVYDFFFDKFGLLWIASGKGISTIETQGLVGSWSKEQGIPGSVEKLTVTNSYIQLATRSDIFRSHMADDGSLVFKNEKLIEESTYDQIAVNIDGRKTDLIVGYNGIYEVDENNKVRDIAPDVYAYGLYQSKFNPRVVYVGGEDFLGRLTYQNNKWQYDLLKNNLNEIRSFVEVGENLYFGVRSTAYYKLNMSDPKHTLIELALGKNVEKPDQAPQAIIFKNKPYLGTNLCLGEIVNRNKIQNVTLKGIDTIDMQYVLVHRMYNENDEKLWMSIYSEKKDEELFWDFGFFTVENDVFEWNSRYNKEDFKKVNPINSFTKVGDNFLLGGLKSVAVFNLENYDKINKPWKVYVGYSDKAEGDDLVMIRENNTVNKPSFVYDKTIYIQISSNNPYNQGITKYRTRLKGFSDEWSSYTKVDFKEFARLSHGNYVLEVQGKNYYGFESEVLEFSFTVIPPWYYTWWANIIYVALVILLLILIVRLSITRVKKQNKRLEETVNERTKEIADQNQILEKQKDEIIEKNNDILDSIKYAKRIQNTILPSEDELKASFKENFVFYRPKDIVSGDFYWSREIGSKVLWAAVDCTGHGVPGAFVSIVGNNGLIRATNEFGLSKPGYVLDKLREITIESFKAQGQQDVKDGMDLALCSLDKQTNTLEFSGANNPMLIIRNGECIEVKGSKQPIGAYTHQKPFENHVVKVEKGDCIYLWTDGIVDQFGGPKGKKLKSRPFKNFLLEICHHPMEKQLQLMDEMFKAWKGEIEQIDDVCVFGVRI